MHACAGSYLANRSLPPLDRLPPAAAAASEVRGRAN